MMQPPAGAILLHRTAKLNVCRMQTDLARSRPTPGVEVGALGRSQETTQRVYRLGAGARAKKEPGSNCPGSSFTSTHNCRGRSLVWLQPRHLSHLKRESYSGRPLLRHLFPKRREARVVAATRHRQRQARPTPLSTEPSPLTPKACAS